MQIYAQISKHLCIMYLHPIAQQGSHLEMYKSMMYEKCDLSEKFIWEETGFWANSEHYKLKQAKGCTYVDTLV